MKRNKVIYTGIVILLIILSLFSIVESQKNSIPFKTISNDIVGNIDSKGNFVIKNQQEWSDLWQNTFSNYKPQPQVPIIDFEKEMVIAVFMGRFGSGGYSTEIISVEEEVDTLNITIKNISPSPNCTTTAKPTYPYHLIKIKKINKEIKFKEIDKVDRCGWF